MRNSGRRRNGSERNRRPVRQGEAANNQSSDIRDNFNGDVSGGSGSHNVLRGLKQGRRRQGYRHPGGSGFHHTNAGHGAGGYRQGDFMEEDTRRYRSTDYNADADEFGFFYDNGYDDEDDEEYRDFSLDDIDEDPYSDRDEWGRDERKRRKRQDHSHIRDLRFL